MATTISSLAGSPRRRIRRVGAALLAVGAVTAGSLAIVLAGGSAEAVGTHGPLPQGLSSGSPTPRPSGKCSTPSHEIVREVPWTNQRLALPRVWELTKGQGVLVGVIDTGVDRTVPQLAGHVLPGTDVVDGTGQADTDCFGHGTFVAGIIAAQPKPGTGVAGVAPGATILPIRQANSSSDGTSAGLAQSIRLAADMGAKVVNISASSFFPDPELRAAVQYASAKDVLLVASASNEAQSGNPTAYPAAYPEVLAVGAVDQDGRRSQFSEVGPFLDLVAPGVNIVSLSRAAPGHLSDNGTSYATPFVTATAALVRAAHPKLTAPQVKRRLELTADHSATGTPDPQVGWGVVNPYHAVSAVLPQEHGVGVRLGAPPPMDPMTWRQPDTSARDTAIAFAIGGGAAAAVLVVLAYVLPRGARRRWRPADAPTTGGIDP
jgi:membrane-anchored mycosin MYCP